MGHAGFTGVNLCQRRTRFGRRFTAPEQATRITKRLVRVPSRRWRGKSASMRSARTRRQNMQRFVRFRRSLPPLT